MKRKKKTRIDGVDDYFFTTSNTTTSSNTTTFPSVTIYMNGTHTTGTFQPTNVWKRTWEFISSPEAHPVEDSVPDCDLDPFQLEWRSRVKAMSLTSVWVNP